MEERLYRGRSNRGSAPAWEGTVDPLGDELSEHHADSASRYRLGADGILHTPLGEDGLERTKQLIPSGPVEISAGATDTTGVELLSSTEYGVVVGIVESGGANAVTPGLKNAAAAAAAGNIIYVGASIAASASVNNPLTSLLMKGPLWGYRSGGTGTATFRIQLYARE